MLRWSGRLAKSRWRVRRGDGKGEHPQAEEGRGEDGWCCLAGGFPCLYADVDGGGVRVSNDQEEED